MVGAEESIVAGQTGSQTRDEALKALFEDDFEAHHNESLEDPAYRAAFEDAANAHRALATLVMIRKAKRLTQKIVARRMGVEQPAVSQFEKTTGDPRLSTLQRYARAVECRLDLRVTHPARCDWVSPASVGYTQTKTDPITSTTVRPDGKASRGWSHKSTWAEQGAA